MGGEKASQGRCHGRPRVWKAAADVSISWGEVYEKKGLGVGVV